MFREARELKAFVALSLGVKSLERARAIEASDGTKRQVKNRYYNDARRYFCSADNLLKEARAMAQDIGPSRREWDDIISYAGEAARRTAELARVDPQYIGGLKLLTAENLVSCGPGSAPEGNRTPFVAAQAGHQSPTGKR
jgi:hypothetical protein